MYIYIEVQKILRRLFKTGKRDDDVESKSLSPALSIYKAVILHETLIIILKRIESHFVDYTILNI